MADPAFKAEQWAGIRQPHVRPVNELVDRLQNQDGRGWLPHVAPWHGGVEARVLSVLRDPGPRTQEGSGSGLLCTENDDPTAEWSAKTFEWAGISHRDVTPWNAYPWYINRAPRSEEREAGIGPLLSLISLMPSLAVVLLQGRDAQASWRLLQRRHPDVPGLSGVTVISTFHPSPQALWHPDPDVRAQRRQHRLDAYARVAAELTRSR